MEIISANWFEVAVRYTKTIEDGTRKAMTERYGVDAMSFTEAESRIIDALSGSIDGEYRTTSESQATYTDVVLGDCDNDEYWFKVKLQFINIDERTGKEKYSNVMYLVQAQSVASALNNINTAMRDTLADYRVVSVCATKLINVFTYKEQK